MSAGVLAGMAAMGWAQPPKPDSTYKPSHETPAAQPPREVEPTYKPSRDMRPVVLVPTDWLDDESIRGLNDEKLGEVKDIIISREKGRITYIIMGHGGVLKVGEKVSAVPYAALGWDHEKKHLTLPMTPEQLKSAPTMETSDWKGLAEPARTEPINSFFSTATNRRVMDDEPAAVRPEEKPRLKPEEFPVLRVSDIKGKALAGNDGRDIGTVNDLVVDANSGRIAFVAVTFGGVLGVGSDKVAVPWPAFDVNKEGHLYAVAIDKDVIRSAPHLTQKDWGELQDPTFGAQVYKHFGRQSSWLEAGAAGGAGGMKTDYDRQFLQGTPKEVSGTITSIDEESPMSGMPKYTVLTVRTDGGQTETVHACPKSHLDKSQIMLKTGDSVKVSGREAQINGKPVLIATAITSGGRSVSLRRDDGSADW